MNDFIEKKQNPRLMELWKWAAVWAHKAEMQT